MQIENSLMIIDCQCINRLQINRISKLKKIHLATYYVLYSYIYIYFRLLGITAFPT